MRSLPTVALVGRPNVGKSTLFNRLTASRDALVADLPGLTRDRQYGIARLRDRLFTVIDTGGLVGEDAGAALQSLTTRQVELALEDAQLVVLLVDLRDGVTTADHEIAELLRRQGATVLLVGNKADGIDPASRQAELYELGLGEPLLVSAAHNRGIGSLVDELLERFPDAAEEVSEEDADAGIMVAVIGRPNVGKSTLVNRLLGEERVVVFDAPGTTRDSIYVPFERDGERYTLIDTAGVRRRGRVEEVVEKFSIVKALEAITRADVVVLVIDARESIVEQDLRLLGHALQVGRTIVLAVNKWDGMSAATRAEVREEIDRRLSFAPWIQRQTISALHGTGVGELIERVQRLHLAARIRHSPSELTEMLAKLLEAHSPPLVNGRRIKLRFAHSGGDRPPTVVIHGNQTAAVPDAYLRYLEHGFRDALRLDGTALRIVLRTGNNPFAGKRNELNERQKKRRQRVIAHDRARDHKGRGKR